MRTKITLAVLFLFVFSLCGAAEIRHETNRHASPDALLKREINVGQRIQETCAANYPIRIMEEYISDGRLKTQKGAFSPPELRKLEPVFSDYLKAGVRFLDINSLDGRAVMLAAFYGAKATGIEQDNRLYALSLKARKMIADIIPSGIIHFQRADYMSFNISSFDVIFINPGIFSVRALLDKLAAECPDGAVLIFLEFDPEKESSEWAHYFVREREYPQEVLIYRKSSSDIQGERNDK